MPKLPKGMFQRGRSYYVRLRVDGKDVWRSLGTDYLEAKRKLQQLRSGATPLHGRMTVVEAAGRWLETYIATSRNEKGRSQAAARVGLYLKPFFAFVPLWKVTPEHIRRYRLWLEGRDISPTTVWHILSDVRCLLRWCEEIGLVDRSPFPRRVMPRLQERPPDRLNDEEVARLLTIREPYGFVVRLALGTGLRWGELTRSQAAHVEGDMLVVSQTKSGRVRRVPLAPELLREIRSRVGRLVPFAEGSPGSFAKVIRRECGLPRFHVHQMRHTFGCQWVERGGNAAALQQILGHQSIVTTQRYARLSDDAVRREAERLNGGRSIGAL